MTRIPGYDAWKTRSDLDEWYRYNPGEEPEPCPNCEGGGCSSCEPDPEPEEEEAITNDVIKSFANTLEKAKEIHGGGKS